MNIYDEPDPPLPDIGDPEAYTCPCCGAELGGSETVYVDKHGEAIGCEYCIFEKQAYEAIRSDKETEEDIRDMWEEDRWRLEREERML